MAPVVLMGRPVSQTSINLKWGRGGFWVRRVGSGKAVGKAQSYLTVMVPFQRTAEL